MTSRTARFLFVLSISTMLSAVLFIGAAVKLGGDAEALRQTLRLSGRLSFLLFLPPLLASALMRLLPSKPTRWLMAQRAEAGLVFGGAHLAHLGLIVWLATFPETSFPPIVIGFGGAGLLIIAAMVVTTFPAPRRALGPLRWRALHRVGIHYIGVVFAYDWFKGLAVDPVAYAPLAFLLLAAFGARLFSAKQVASLRV